MGSNPSSIPDFGFQNEKTGSTLALSSGCRKTYRKSAPPLRSIVQSLGSGLTQVRKKEQIEFRIRGVAALRSTVTGIANGREIMIHDVVLTHDGCIFDLTLVSLVRHFQNDLPAFEKVLTTLPISP